MRVTVFRECITKVAHNIIIIYISTDVYVHKIQFAHLTRYVMQRYYVQAGRCNYLDLLSEATPRRRVSNTLKTDTCLMVSV